ncbi:MAG: T9SS type A sorting domain-containing protein [Calditrichia bacterium]
MFKKISTILLVVLFGFSATLFAREEAKVQKVTPEVEAEWVKKLDANADYPVAPVNFSKARIELGRTFYDYATNNIMGRMLDKANNAGTDGIHFAFMKIFPTSASERFVTYDYYDIGTNFLFGNQSITEDARTGWGRVLNGKNDEAIVSHHGGGNRLWQDVGEANYFFANVLTVGASAGAVFPGIARQGDNVSFTNQSNGDWIPIADSSFMISNDYMATWTANSIGAADPLTTDYGQSELWPTFDPLDASGQSLAYVHTPDITATGPNGAVWWQSTTDGGATWAATEVQNEDIATGDAFYIIDNFGQLNSQYTSDGNYHIVYGAVQGVDTMDVSRIALFPIVYWSKDEGVFKELTSVEAGRPADTTAQNGLADLRPGNGLGNAYPQLSEGPNGELLCIWQQWEDNGSGGLVTVVGSAGAEKFMTDIWGAYSPDGGLSWSAPFFVAGTPGESDVFPNLTPTFDISADSVNMDMIYFMDPDPGVSLFADNNGPSEGVWYYENVGIALSDIILGIEDQSTAVIGDFKLAQNYPNPFNPSTTIEYSLDKSADITVTVYNLAGQKVATLVNGRQNAGTYSINFDASDLASGVYFYRLASQNVNLTQKMILMK